MSQVRLLSSVRKRQRIDDTRYGFPPFEFIQDVISEDERNLAILLSTQTAVREFVPNALVQSLRVRKDSKTRKLILDITFVDKRRFQTPQQVLINLDIGNPAQVL